MRKIKTAIGLMSGTSMDGIDIALIKTDGRHQVEFGPSGFVAYEPAFSQRIAAALKTAKSIDSRSGRPGDLAALEIEITQRHADAVASFLTDHDLAADDIDVIGLHGQTVLHRPQAALTVQLGDGAALATATGIDVVADMRAKDMENGGQGAPLVPAFHQALARQAATDGPVAYVNIGGIANITITQQDAAPLAFDCGPGNVLIDQWMRRKTNSDVDHDGALGLEGKADLMAVAAYLADPFYFDAAPKSLDRDDFTLEHLPDLAAADGAATLAELTAASIAHAADTASVTPVRWIISGGGVHNRAIMARLKAHLGEERVLSAEQADLSSDAMEAQAWAYLAVRSLRGLALSWPSTTGCEEPVSGGVLHRP